MKILIVEDNQLLAESLQDMLCQKNFEVDCVFDGTAGVEYALLQIYDLIILDVMLPKLNGYEVARRIRAHKCTTPILMLTAKTSINDRVCGLDAGADYYLGKPFDERELMACVNALLRRQGNQVDELTFGNTALELASCLLVCGSKSVRLSAKEYDIMRILMAAGKSNVPKMTLLLRVWGYESSATENNVEVYIGFLRKKLRSINSNITIEAARKIGYHLALSDKVDAHA